jgi:hypothetical protein
MLSSSLPRNVPGQDPLSREYPGPLPHHVPQSEAIHPRNGAGYGVAHRSQASGLPSLQYGTGHVTSLQGHSMGQSSRLASLQLYSVQPVSVPRSPAAVQNAYGGAYPSLYLSLSFILKQYLIEENTGLQTILFPRHLPVHFCVRSSSLSRLSPVVDSNSLCLLPQSCQSHHNAST